MANGKSSKPRFIVLKRSIRALREAGGDPIVYHTEALLRFVDDSDNSAGPEKEKALS